ncbi:extracellular solute-binding protein (family 3) [Halopolyspora algeriensis]|uniref:Extracellular solute-binding protein (Family 3) n=1 Tax=Halopolyspora algeriensis TaxID=1500506 RepID=A0A368VSC3_9ACTN|nr:transporter substrate-binding domain-containing protein [Halopolyspora algeriensis]RCW44025.1 extracellular solute-binding protein (family 3) [Halopolyspora algeriensis]TQM53472.1 extracellular solute-binding protein (family 3) [Halopolyspora algeriensis]
MRSRAAAVMVSAGVLLSACGQGESPGRPTSVPGPASPGGSAVVPSPSSDPVEVQGSPTIAEIRKRGTLLVGLRSDAPEFVHRERGEYTGFDVRIARMLAEGLGLDPETRVAFRLLPPTLRADAIATGSVDIQIGGVDPQTSRVAEVGPYALTGPRAATTAHFLGIPPHDAALREELRHILTRSVAEGRWRRAYEATLGEAGVAARPPDLPR